MSIENIRKLKDDAKERPVSKYLRPVAEKRENKLKEQLRVAELDDEFYDKLWASRPRVDFETGKPITNKKWRRWNWHHCLLKSEYPQYRHEEWNVVLVSLPTHDQAHLDIDKCPRIKAYTQSLKDNLGI